MRGTQQQIRSQKRISEFEGKSIEVFQSEIQKEKEIK